MSHRRPKLTAERPLSKQTAALNTSQSARPWLDLTYQLLGIVFALLPVLLAVHLLTRDPGDPARTLGLDARRPGRDLARGAGLAALIGLPGLALFWVAAQLGAQRHAGAGGAAGHSGGRCRC